jgi:NitT/TauT family transport system substrate-binding protein
MGKADGYQALVHAAVSGDQKAFNELVKRFYGMAFTAASHRLNDRGLAEDAVQEAFLTAFLKLAELKNKAAFPSWLRRILFTSCTRIEKKHHKLLTGNTNAFYLLEDQTPGPEDLMVRYQSKAMVAKTLALLDSVSREACIQRYVYGRSYKEIAADLQVPLGTIKRRLHAARDKVIKVFEHQEERPSLTVGYLPISDHLLGMISHCLNRGRLRIHMRKFLSWSSLVRALKNELLDAAFIMAPIALVLHNKGVPICYVMDAHHEGSAITVRNDKAAGWLSNSDRLGMPNAISTHSILFAEMSSIDCMPDLGAIQTKYCGPSYLQHFLISGEIDAFFCAEPWNTKAEIEGAGRILARSKDFLPGHICCILVVREEILGKRRELIRSYLKLLLSANDYLSADYRRSAKIQELYTGVSADIIEHVLRKGEVNFTDIIPDHDRINKFMRIAIRAGVLDAPCDLDRFVRNDII